MAVTQVRSRGRRSVRALVAAALVSCVSRGARAGDVALSWARGDGADRCPDGTEIAREVVRRLDRDPFGPDAVQRIEALVTHTTNGWSARLYVRDAAGTLAGTRVIDSAADDCGPLAAATVIAIALAIDPSTPPATRPAVAVTGALPPVATARGWIRPRGGTVTLQGIVLGAMLPAVAFGGGVAVDALVWGPVRIRGGGFFPADVGGTGAMRNASYDLVAGYVAVCGEVWPHDRIALGVCLGGALGELIRTGDAAVARTLDAAWGGPLGEVHVVVPVVGPLVAEAGVSGIVGLTTESFAVPTRTAMMLPPDRTLTINEHYARPAVAVLGTVGLGVRF